MIRAEGNSVDAAGCAPFPQQRLDVGVIGGGQSGIAIAHALRRAGITGVVVFDRAAPGDLGTWRRTARMKTLRTNKHISGPEGDEPHLSFRRWLKIARPSEDFDSFSRIPRLLWAEYVDWYRDKVGVRVVHRANLCEIRPVEGGMALVFTDGGTNSSIEARTVVLATGMDGCGAPYVPRAIVEAIPRDRWQHTEETIDFASLEGQRVGILGAAAGAFDASIEAMEHGAAEVHLFCRGDTLAIQAKPDELKDPAFIAAFRDLPDQQRYDLIAAARARSAAPAWSIEHARRFKNFHLHFGAGESQIETRPEGLEVRTRGRCIPFDRLIVATGYEIDLVHRMELRTLAPLVLRWADRLPSTANSFWGRYPYLGPNLQFMGRLPVSSVVGHVFCYNFAAILSHGVHVGDIASAGIFVDRLVEGILEVLTVQ